MIELGYKEYRIKISSDILEILIRYIQSQCKYESGGMLIGSILIDGKTIEINDCTEPIKEDKCTRYGFYRSDKHNKFLEAKWIQSKFKKMYFGEWHTHPQEIPIPSYIDKRSWKRLIKESITDSPILIFLIVGEKAIEIWVGNRSENKLERCGDYRF